MKNKIVGSKCFIITIIFVITVSCRISWTQEDVSEPAQPFISNYDHQCTRCLCHATSGCNYTYGCNAGYCGPFRISRIYWVDGGKVVLPEDDVERAKAYNDCVLNYKCAQKVVLNYLIKYGRDCNGDGVTNCDDYSLINGRGPKGCHVPLNTDPKGRAWLERYEACMKNNDF